MHACMYVCMYVLYIHIYVCMHVCMIHAVRLIAAAGSGPFLTGLCCFLLLLVIIMMRQAVKMAREALSAGDSTGSDNTGSDNTGSGSAAPTGAAAEGDVDMAVCGQRQEERAGQVGECAQMREEIRRLKEELQLSRDENRLLRAEKHTEMHNSSYSSQRSDAEPLGSQESPVRCFAQVLTVDG